MKKTLSIILGTILISSYIFPTITNAKQSIDDTVTVLVGGDIMLSRSVGSFNKKTGYDRILKNYNPTNGYKNSLFIANLESPFSNPDLDKNAKTFLFGANPKNISILNTLGERKQTFMSLANNHITNSGKSGMLLTEKTLSDNSISYNGIRKGISEMMVNGSKVCISSHTYDGGKGYNGFYIKGLNDTDFDNAFKDMDSAHCSIRLFTLHWGSEYKFGAIK